MNEVVFFTIIRDGAQARIETANRDYAHWNKSVNIRDLYNEMEHLVNVLNNDPIHPVGVCFEIG